MWKTTASGRSVTTVKNSTQSDRSQELNFWLNYKLQRWLQAWLDLGIQMMSSGLGLVWSLALPPSVTVLFSGKFSPCDGRMAVSSSPDLYPHSTTRGNKVLTLSLQAKSQFHLWVDQLGSCVQSWTTTAPPGMKHFDFPRLHTHVSPTLISVEPAPDKLSGLRLRCYPTGREKRWAGTNNNLLL